MSKLITAASLTARYNARYPATGGVLGSVEAAGGKLGSVEAAGLRPFSSPGKLKVIKATQHFYVAGEVILTGDLVEVSEPDAAYILNSGRGVEATDEEITAAKAPQAKGK